MSTMAPIMLRLAYAAVFVASTSAFVHVPVALTRACPASTRTRRSTTRMLAEDEYLPRTVQVAGALPDLTVEDVQAVTSSPPAGPGTWQYDFSDPEGPQMGTVAIPGSALMESMTDPVAVVVPNDIVGVTLPQDDNVELLAVVDRADLEFQIGKFFLWGSPGGPVVLRSFETKEDGEGFLCLGRVHLVFVPFLPTMAKKSTGFEEEDMDF